MIFLRKARNRNLFQTYLLVKYSKLFLSDQGQDKDNYIRGLSQCGNAGKITQRIRIENKEIKL